MLLRNLKYALTLNLSRTHKHTEGLVHLHIKSPRNSKHLQLNCKPMSRTSLAKQYISSLSLPHTNMKGKIGKTALKKKKGG